MHMQWLCGYSVVVWIHCMSLRTLPHLHRLRVVRLVKGVEISDPDTTSAMLALTMLLVILLLVDGLFEIQTQFFIPDLHTCKHETNAGIHVKKIKEYKDICV